MDIIATGAQYKVIDTHDGRVRKIPLTAEESRAVVESWYAPGEAPTQDLAIDYFQLALDSCAGIQALLGRHPELGASFGNPRFEDEGVYTQDKVQLLGKALSQRSAEEGRELIDDFIDLVLGHWQYGVSERVFNCTFNNGIAAHGSVILLDFGEITTDRDKVVKAISSQRWLRSMSYKRDIPEQLKDYYRDSLAGRLTIQALETSWGLHQNSGL